MNCCATPPQSPTRVETVLGHARGVGQARTQGPRLLRWVKLRSKPSSRPRRPRSSCGAGPKCASTTSATAAAMISAYVSSSSSSAAAARFSSRWLTEPVPGIGTITGERRSSHASATWDGVAPSRLAAPCHRASRSGQLAGRDRGPGHEADAVLGAVVEHVFGLGVGQVVAVLHGGHREVPARLLDLRDAHLGQTEGCDLALGLQLGELGELLLGGTLRSIRCSCSRSSRSTLSLRRLSSTCWRRYSARPLVSSGRDLAGCSRLGADLHPSG